MKTLREIYSAMHEYDTVLAHDFYAFLIATYGQESKYLEDIRGVPYRDTMQQFGTPGEEH